MILGQAFHGLLDPFILIPTLPEMIESVLPHYPESAEHQINDLSSGIFNMFLGIGQVIGPLYGSYVTGLHGFRYCSDLVSIICLAFAVMYYIFGEGAKAFQESYWINETIEDEIEQDDSFEPMKNKVLLQRNESMKYVRMLSIHSPSNLGLRAQDLLVPNNEELKTQK